MHTITPRTSTKTWAINIAVVVTVSYGGSQPVDAREDVVLAEASCSTFEVRGWHGLTATQGRVSARCLGAAQPVRHLESAGLVEGSDHLEADAYHCWDSGTDDFCNSCDACTARGPQPLCDRPTLFLWSSDPEAEGGAPGRDEPLVTDRPDFTEASVLVGRGVAQLEFGYTYVFDDEPGERFKAHSIGEPLLRVGVLAEWIELRLGWNYVEETTSNAAGRELITGATDMFVGLKIGLTPQSGILPEMALIPQMVLPTGTGALSKNEVLPGLIWIYAWEINDFITTAGSTQGNRTTDTETGDAFLSIAQSWTIGYSLTERLGMYTEWFAFFPHSADTEHVQHFADGGFTFLLSNDVQYDVRAGIGLDSHADDYFVGSGFSVRF